MTAPDWHERWMRLKEYIKKDMVFCRVFKMRIVMLTYKVILSEMARLEKEKR
jgi:hypothetical protein